MLKRRKGYSQKNSGYKGKGKPLKKTTYLAFLKFKGNEKSSQNQKNYSQNVS